MKSNNKKWRESVSKLETKHCGEAGLARSFRALALATSVAVLPWAMQSPASTIVGALSNFDVNNDTGGPADDFEITVPGVTPAQIIGTWNFNFHYGHPTISNVTGGTLVHYVS